MKCVYCDNECLNKEDMQLCESCLCAFSIGNDGALLYSIWYVEIEEKAYCIKSYDFKTGNAPEFVIYYRSPDGSWGTLKRFNFVPQDWNPKNCKHKLKTYLPFL